MNHDGNSFFQNLSFHGPNNLLAELWGRFSLWNEDINWAKQVKHQLIVVVIFESLCHTSAPRDLMLTATGQLEACAI